MSRRLGKGARNLVATIFTPFDPSDLAGVVAWWRGDSITAAGDGTITLWTDKSGNGADATPPGAFTPSINNAGLGGHAAATYTGGAQVLDGNLAAGLNSLTIWMVVNPVPQVGRADPFGLANYRQVFGYLNAQVEAYNNVDLVFTDLVATPATPYWSQTKVDSVSSHWSAVLNGTVSALNPIASAVAMTGTAFHIGAGDDAGSGAWVGDISEIVIIDHVSTPTEDANMHSYFMHYYGLP